MEREGYSLESGAENQGRQVELSPPMMMTEKPKAPVSLAPPFQDPLKEAEPLMVNVEEDSIQDQVITNPENLQHPKAQEGNFQQRFRHFRYKDASGPRQLLQHLRELSRRWLDPDVLTKEQIIELLVQEQFQAIVLKKLTPSPKP